MSEVPSKLEAVRLARERLGEAPAAEVAAFVETAFGVKMQPAIAAVLLASLRERECLEESKRRALESAGLSPQPRLLPWPRNNGRHPR